MPRIPIEQSIEPDSFPFWYHIAISNPYVLKHIYHSGHSDCILIKYIVDTLQSLALRLSYCFLYPMLVYGLRLPNTQAQTPKDKVFVMYAASLIKTFEDILGPAFQNETGYPYEGEARGSVQVANMIMDGSKNP